VQEIDPDTGAAVDAINDELLADMEALTSGGATETLRFVPRSDVDLRAAVPVYHDRRFIDHYREAMCEPNFNGFTSATIGDLIKSGHIEIRGGHGSPSQDQRIGEVPYIKVSDLRAGLVNINPTNRVPRSVAQRFWRGLSSGLRQFDLLSPERTSKNIGDFCVLMPGQEEIVVTKEVIVLRPGPAAEFDAFYLLWAMTLTIVRDQWRRIVFMQTNREDVGKRYHEIEIPLAPSAQRALDVSKTFRDYFTTIADARRSLAEYLTNEGDHHFFVSGVEPPSEVAKDGAPEDGVRQTEGE
jgi:type I restriction enzyme M protein